MSTDSGTVRVAALQVAYDDQEAHESRWARISELIRVHRDHDVVVLPELWAHGAFSPGGWAVDAEPLDGSFVARLQLLARTAGILLHSGSMIERGPESGPEGRSLWNTSVVIDAGGEVRATYRKIHRFGFGEGEPLLLEAGITPTILEACGMTTGLAICYDLRFPEHFRNLVSQGAETFLIPASWPAARREHWQLLGRARALENQAYVVQVNTVGTHGGIEMGGHSQVVDPTGTVIAEAGDGEEVLSVELDLAMLRSFRREFPVLDDRRVSALVPDRAVR